MACFCHGTHLLVTVLLQIDSRIQNGSCLAVLKFWSGPCYCSMASAPGPSGEDHSENPQDKIKSGTGSSMYRDSALNDRRYV